jgi:hypothetical protein
MSQMLATDLQNPEFTGAISNPDALLHVEFYLYKPLDKWASEVKSAEAGRLIRVYGDEQPFVRIMRPGDQTSIIETPVREAHKARWPEQWLYFQMREGLVDEKEVPGWKLEEWPFLSDKQDMLRELKFGRYSTVEQVAGASDAQVQKMGLGGVGFREQARTDLRKKLSSDLNEAIASKDKEVAEMKAQMAIMTEQMARLTEAMTEKKRG